MPRGKKGRDDGGGCVRALDPPIESVQVPTCCFSSSPVSFSPIILAEDTTSRIFGMILNELATKAQEMYAGVRGKRKESVAINPRQA